MQRSFVMVLLSALACANVAAQDFDTPCGKAIVSHKEDSIKINDKAFFMLAAKWSFSTIFVCWENPTANDAKERKWVKEAISNTWQKYSRLTFQYWGACQPDTYGIRILVEDSGPHTKGLGKFVALNTDGSIKRNNMVLNFSFINWKPACDGTREQCIRTIAVHEFGHALGFAHEQNRPDTPGECAKRAQGTTPPDPPLTPWDLKSVMNYCNPSQKQEALSACDIVGLQKIYLPPG